MNLTQMFVFIFVFYTTFGVLLAYMPTDSQSLGILFFFTAIILADKIRGGFSSES